MKNIENRLLNLLTDLKNNFGADAVKVSFEDEGACFEEALYFKHLAGLSGLECTAKTGGCSAAADMLFLERNGIKSIAAPMIETVYAAEKFLNTAGKFFSSDVKLYITIETEQALRAADDILKLNFQGIILGRSDFARSTGLKNAECAEILDTAVSLSLKAEKYNKKFITGGAVCPESIPFLKKIPYLYGFETRKIVFNAEKALKTNPKEGILKALEFEMLYLENSSCFGAEERIKVLKNRLNA